MSPLEAPFKIPFGISKRDPGKVDNNWLRGAKGREGGHFLIYVRIQEVYSLTIF